MDPIELLRKQATDLATEVESLMSLGRTDEAMTKLGEAQKAMDQADTLEKAAHIKAANAKSQPLPAALPTDAEANPFNGTGLNGGEDGEALIEGIGIKNKSIKSAYAVRYGEPNTAVKAILTDLYGPSYDQVRWDQQIAFTKYLRSVDHEPDRSDRTLLSQVVLTPDLVLKAIQEGVDVSYLKATIVEARPILGGYIVPVDFQAKIIERQMGYVVMRRLAMVTQTSRDKVEYPVATGGDHQRTSAIRGKWVEEKPTAGTAASTLTFGSESIPVNTYMSEVPISRNNIEDSAFNISDYLGDKFGEDVGVSEDNAFILGDGNGKPEGLLPGGENVHNFTVVYSGVADALTDYDVVIDMSYAIDSQYRRNGGCVWIAQKDTYKSIAKMKSATAEYYWDRAERTQRKLEGYSAEEQEAMPAIAAGANVALFGDVRGYRIVDRVGMTVERYLDSATARENLVIYVLRARRGGQVTDPWRFAVLQIGTGS